MPHITRQFCSKRFLRFLGLTGLLVGTIGLGAIACSPEPSTSSNTATTGPHGEINPVKDTIIGEWQIIPDPNKAVGTIPRWVFTGNNQLVILDLSGPESGVSQVGSYAINTESSPMQLDIIFPEEEQLIFTIFELTNEAILNVQKNESGLPRPTVFDDNIVTLQKLSDSTESVSAVSSVPTASPDGTVYLTEKDYLTEKE